MNNDKDLREKAERAAEWYENNTDCYADTWKEADGGNDGYGPCIMVEGEVIPAMTKERFLSCPFIAHADTTQQGISEEEAGRMFDRNCYTEHFEGIPAMTREAFIKAVAGKAVRVESGREGDEAMLNFWQKEVPQILNLYSDVVIQGGDIRISDFVAALLSKQLRMYRPYTPAPANDRAIEFYEWMRENDTKGKHAAGAHMSVEQKYKQFMAERGLEVDDRVKVLVEALEKIAECPDSIAPFATFAQYSIETAKQALQLFKQDK